MTMDPDIRNKLQTRLVNGEITQDEYKQLLATLSGTAPTQSALPSAEYVLGAEPPRVSLGQQYLNAGFYTWAYVVFGLISFILFIFATVLMIESNSRYGSSSGDAILGSLTFLLAIAFGIASAVVFFNFLYKAWKSVQHFQVRTTPGKAVGFCFIPFFNFYWYFVALTGFVDDFNRVVEAEGRRELRIERVIGLLPPIMMCIGVVPYVNCLASLVLIVVLPIYIWTVSSKVNQYLNNR